MKYLLFVFLFVSQSVFGGIVDPTYDDFFKMLFGDDGEILYDEDGKPIDWPEKRLQAFLNSILKPAFKIEVLSLEYKNVGKQPDVVNGKKLVFDIFTSCECRYLDGAKGKRMDEGLTTSDVLDVFGEKNIDTFKIDIEMQKGKFKNYEARTIFYGNVINVKHSRAAKRYVEQPKTMVISILDGVLSGYKGKAIFYIGPCVKDILNFDPEKSEVKDGDLVQLSPIQLFVQLPVFCEKVANKENGRYVRAIKDFNSTVTNKENENDYTTNEWLLLLGSRRLCCDWNTTIGKEGKYEVNTAFFSNNEVKNSISVLQKVNDAFYQSIIAKYQYDLQQEMEQQRATELLKKRNKKLKNENAQMANEIAQLRKQLAKRSQHGPRKIIKQSVQKGKVTNSSKFTHKKKLRFFQDSTKK